MINLDYFYRSDIYELNHILLKGLAFDCYKTSREYGYSLYLTDKPNKNLNNKNVILNVHLKSLDNILIVTNFQELLNNYLLPITTTALSNINVMSPPSSINSITLSSGDIIGLSGQSNALQNGIYIFMGAGVPLERSIDVVSYVNHFGKTARLGTKYIQKYMIANGYSGLKITSENLLVLYDTSNVKYIKVYDKQ